jgi:hypothetical protein
LGVSRSGPRIAPRASPQDAGGSAIDTCVTSAEVVTVELGTQALNDIFRLTWSATSRWSYNYCHRVANETRCIFYSQRLDSLPNIDEHATVARLRGQSYHGCGLSEESQHAHRDLVYKQWKLWYYNHWLHSLFSGTISDISTGNADDMVVLDRHIGHGATHCATSSCV